MLSHILHIKCLWSFVTSYNPIYNWIRGPPIVGFINGCITMSSQCDTGSLCYRDSSCFSRAPWGSGKRASQDLETCEVPLFGITPHRKFTWRLLETRHVLILLMAEILHHLGCIKPCK